MGDVIEIDRLGRVYNYSSRPGRHQQKNEVAALADISVTIAQGEIIGLLGPNGAGKTTLIKILATALLPSSGTARVLGLDVVRDAPQVRGRLGIVFGGERGLYGRLTVQDNLEYWSAMYRVPRRTRPERVAGLLDLVGLATQARTPVDRLSKGMKQRVHLARGLVNDPAVVIMDEPTSGMDPVGARQFRALVSGLRHDGRTVLIATHDMSEAEELCDRVILLDHGRIRGIEDPRAVGRWLETYERIEARGVGPGLLSQVLEVPGVTSAEDIDDGWLRIHANSHSAAPAVLRLLVDSGISSLRTSRPSLEEVYLQLIGDRGLAV